MLEKAEASSPHGTYVFRGKSIESFRLCGRGRGRDSIETCKLSYVKPIASPGSVHETGCSGLVPWDDPEGWDGEGGGRGDRDGEHMYTHSEFKSMYGKTNTVL